MKQHISNKDAIHIACAIEAECDYFITTDDNLIKRYNGNEITICSPIELIKLLEGQDE